MHARDLCRFSVAATGAFLHPLGDQTPIDCRYGELIDTVQLPHREMLYLTKPTVVPFGALQNPRAVVVWNMSGCNQQTQPTTEEAAAIAAQVLYVAVVSADCPRDPTPDDCRQLGWLELRPAGTGKSQGGSQVLWLAPGAHVVLRPATEAAAVVVRALVIPGASS